MYPDFGEQECLVFPVGKRKPPVGKRKSTGLKVVGHPYKETIHYLMSEERWQEDREPCTPRAHARAARDQGSISESAQRT